MGAITILYSLNWEVNNIINLGCSRVNHKGKINCLVKVLYYFNCSHHSSSSNYKSKYQPGQVLLFYNEKPLNICINYTFSNI